jgi:hypothetical protein
MSFETTRGPELVAALAEVTVEIRRLQARSLDIVAEMEQEQVAKAAGYSSLAAFLRDTFHVSQRAARRMVTQAQQLTPTVTPTGHETPAPLPTLREALREGAVDVDHVDVVAEVLKNLPDDARLEDRELIETTLAEQARELSPDALRKFGQQVLDRINQDGREPEPTELAEPTNTLRYRRTHNNRLVATLDIDSEAAEEFEGLLIALGAPQSPIPGVPDPRSQAERYGDAFTDIVHLAAKTNDVPSQGGSKAMVSITLDINTLLEGTGIATFDSGAPLCPEAARRHACDADVIPIVLNGESVPLDLGRKHRLVKPHQRRALIARDRGCAFPSCHLPPRWTDAHHVIHVRHEALDYRAEVKGLRY